MEIFLEEMVRIFFVEKREEKREEKRGTNRKIDYKDVFFLENIFQEKLENQMETGKKTGKMTLDELKAEYVKSLTEQERKAYEIALDHLKGIFYLEETNGFLEWKKKKGF